jgi:hypothetical protein
MLIVILFLLSIGTATAAIKSTYTPPCTDKKPSCRDDRLESIETELSSLDSRISALEGGPTPKPSVEPTVSQSTKPSPSPEPTKTSDSRSGGVMYYGASVQGSPENFEDGTGIFGGKGLSSTLPVYRSYFRADSIAPQLGVRAKADHANGRLSIISTKVPGTWAEMAAGKYDNFLIDRIYALSQSPGEVLFVLHHEPTSEVGGVGYQPQDWIAMNAHAKVLKDEMPGAGNVKITGILNGWDLARGGSYSDRWKSSPSDGAFDYYGADRYNGWSETNGIKFISVEEWGKFIQVLRGWGWDGRIVIGETGVREYTQPGVSSKWLIDQFAYCENNGVYAMSYFNSGLNSPDGSWTLDGERLEAFRGNTKYSLKINNS